MAILKVSWSRVKMLPRMARMLCFGHDGWVVGSGAAFLLNLREELPEDWDILIPLHVWPFTQRVIPIGTPANGAGGFKIDKTIDVWTDDIGRFMANAPSHPQYAVQPLTHSVLVGLKGQGK